MLWFAFGLTFARPSTAPVVGFNWRTAATVFFLLLGPVAAFLVPALAAVSLINLFDVTDHAAQYSTLAAFVIPAGLIGWWCGRRSVVSGPVPLAVVLTLAVTASTLGFLPGGGDEAVVGIAIWAPGLLITLLLAARLAQTRRTALASVAGVLVFMVVLDGAYVAEHFRAISNAAPPSIPEDSWLLAAHAPMWFVYALTGQSFGILPHYERLVVGYEAFPHSALSMGVFAVFYAVRAARQRAQSSESVVKPA